MATISVSGSTIAIETDLLSAEVHTEGYVSGVFRDTFGDKETGARDHSFGAAHAVGWFEDVAEMKAVAAQRDGATGTDVNAGGRRLLED